MSLVAFSLMLLMSINDSDIALEMFQCIFELDNLRYTIVINLIENAIKILVNRLFLGDDPI